MRKDRVVLVAMVLWLVAGVMVSAAFGQPDDPYDDNNGGSSGRRLPSSPGETTPSPPPSPPPGPSASVPASPASPTDSVLPTTVPGENEPKDEDRVLDKDLDRTLPRAIGAPQARELLPFTGANLLLFVGIGTAAVGSGVVLVRRIRRRREPG